MSQVAAVASATVLVSTALATWKSLLEGAALFLGLVNGLFLLRFYTRDRARLRVEPVHPEVYQWWVRLPDSTRDGVPTRRFGFLLYLAFSNAGLRPTTLDRWRLRVRASGFRRGDLVALSIPEPRAEFSGNVKVYNVLGARGPLTDGETRLEAGGTVSGMAYYVYECWGDHDWDPRVSDGRVTVMIRARDVFGNRASARIICSEKSVEELEALVPSLSTIDQAPNKRFEPTPQAHYADADSA
jgi:hypothetical protein